MQEVSAAWIAALEKTFVPESFIKLTLQLANGTKEFSKKNITAFEHSRTSDLLSGSIPTNEIKFSLDNTQREWDITNPTNFAVYLAEASKVTVTYGQTTSEGIEWIPGGVFYLAEWETPSNGLEADFTAKSPLAYMDEEYTGKRAGTLAEIATEACEQSDLPNGDKVRFRFDRILSTISTDFFGKTEKYTRAEILQLVANAAGCIFYIDREGVLCIEPLSSELKEFTISRRKSYSYPEYTMSKQVKGIVVSYGEETVTVPDVAAGVYQTIDNPFIVDYYRAVLVGQWTANILRKRVTLSGEYRADPRLDVLDRVNIQHQSSQESVAVISTLKFTYNGAWRGSYEARILEPYSAAGYSKESYTMQAGDTIFVLDQD